MRRHLAVLAVAGLLLASTAAVADDEERGRGRAPFQPAGDFQVRQGDHAAGGAATGTHVAFTYSESGISGFRAGDRVLFDVAVTGEAGGDVDEDDDDDDGREPPRAQRGQLRVRMPNFTFTAHDTPTAASRLDAEGPVLVSFLEGVVLAAENGERVRFSYGNVSGVLRGDDVVLTGRNVTSDGELLLVLDAPRGPFDVHHRDLSRAIGRGHIGAEATISLSDDDETVEDAIVSYGNVTMQTLRAERGNITVLIDGHGFEGRVIVLNVDGRVLGAQSADKLNILIDNQTVRPASNLTDILDPDDDGFHPEYYVVYDVQAQAFQLIATLPHYSVHVLSVTTAIPLPPPSVVLGVLAGIALLVPSAMLLFRRK